MIPCDLLMYYLVHPSIIHFQKVSYTHNSFFYVHVAVHRNKFIYNKMN
jgi:hypothetical protein